MRPDQHKQKKNNQYKKKHGLTDKVKDDQTKKTNEFRNQKGTTSKSHNSEIGVSSDAKKREYLKERKIKSDTSESSESDSDSQITVGVSSKKGFQRRKVVSNWDRYDLPPDDEEETRAKGEDFSKLLQAAGNSTSQFRFKDEEEEWGAPDQSDVLSLDLKDLSSCVGCVPLYKVLRLNKDLFSAEQITEFEKKSVDKQRQYRSSEVKSNVTSKTKTLVKSNFTSNDDTKPKNSVELNALDELLDSVILETSTQSKLMEKQSAVLSLENDLDDLLSSGNHNQISSSVLKDPLESQEKTTTPSQEDNDLEYWLDNVLDS